MSVMLTKKYYDGFIVHDILDKHLEPEKMFELMKAFAEAKGVDAVEVTRCKNCDWYGIAELKQDGTVDMRYKPSWCYLWKAEMREDDYCSHGVKEDQNEEKYSYLERVGI